MSKYAKVEKETTYSPIRGDYERFVKEQEAKREKRIPEIGAKLPLPEKKKTGVAKMSERMEQSLKPKPSSKPEQKPKIAEKKESPKFIAGFEKSGKPSKIRVGGRSQYSPEQLESRKKMLRMQKGKR